MFHRTGKTFWQRKGMASIEAPQPSETEPSEYRYKPQVPFRDIFVAALLREPGQAWIAPLGTPAPTTYPPPPAWIWIGDVSPSFGFRSWPRSSSATHRLEQ
jgi:hypothetical protein